MTTLTTINLLPVAQDRFRSRVRGKAAITHATGKNPAIAQFAKQSVVLGVHENQLEAVIEIADRDSIDLLIAQPEWWDPKNRVWSHITAKDQDRRGDLFRAVQGTVGRAMAIPKIRPIEGDVVKFEGEFQQTILMDHGHGLWFRTLTIAVNNEMMVTLSGENCKQEVRGREVKISRNAMDETEEIEVEGKSDGEIAYALIDTLMGRQVAAKDYFDKRGFTKTRDWIVYTFLRTIKATIMDTIARLRRCVKKDQDRAVLGNVAEMFDSNEDLVVAN
jgi:hypothetical protein